MPTSRIHGRRERERTSKSEREIERGREEKGERGGAAREEGLESESKREIERGREEKGRRERKRERERSVQYLKNKMK